MGNELIIKDNSTVLTLWTVEGQVIEELKLTPLQFVTAQLEKLTKSYTDLKAIDLASAKLVAGAYSDIRARRIEVDKRLKAEKKRLQDRKKEVEGAANYILSFLSPIEISLKSERDRWESARAAEKEAAQQAENERRAGIMAKIRAIRAIGEQDLGAKSADELFDLVFEVEGMEISALEFQEFIAEAEEIRKQVSTKISLAQERRRLDEERTKIEAERAALETEKAGQDEKQEPYFQQNTYKKPNVIIKSQTDVEVETIPQYPAQPPRPQQSTILDHADDDFFGGTPAINFADPEEVAKKINAAQPESKVFTDREIFENLSEQVMALAQGITDPAGAKAMEFLAEIRADLMDVAKRIVDNLGAL